MEKGDIFFHPDFQFHDGEVGEKRFIVLNSPTGNDSFLVVKTTSKLHGRSPMVGCNTNNDSHGDFYILAGDCFPLDTLVQLWDIYEFTIDEMHKGQMVDKIIKPIGSLPDKLFTQIIFCYHQLKEDIPEKYLNRIGR